MDDLFALRFAQHLTGLVTLTHFLLNVFKLVVLEVMVIRIVLIDIVFKFVMLLQEEHLTTV